MIVLRGARRHHEIVQRLHVGFSPRPRRVRELINLLRKGGKGDRPAGRRYYSDGLNRGTAISGSLGRGRSFVQRGGRGGVLGGPGGTADHCQNYITRRHRGQVVPDQGGLFIRPLHPSIIGVRRENTRGEERRKSNESARSVFGHYSAIPCFGSGFIRNQEGAT